MTAPGTTYRFLFAGGGTGGHLYPAVAIANRLKEMVGDNPGVDIHFVGTKRGIEYRIRERLGYPLHVINVRGLTRSLTLKNLLVPFILIGAMLSTSRLIDKLQPHVVIGTGGYVSWPVIRQAARRDLPIVLQEQNSYPGLTTRKMARHASEVYLGFGGARDYVTTNARVTTCGNPVRPGLAAGPREEALKHFGLQGDRHIVAVIGGSQGSRPINRAIARSLKADSQAGSFQLLWQTGTLDHDQLVNDLGEAASGHVLFPFTDRMDLVYAAADIAIARAGALTIAELEACGVPAVLVPYPHAAGDHQKMNAEEYAESGGALVVAQDRLSKDDILQITANLLTDQNLNAMRAAIEGQRPEEPAVDVIAQGILRLARRALDSGGGSGASNSTT